MIELSYVTYKKQYKDLDEIHTLYQNIGLEGDGVTGYYADQLRMISNNFAKFLN